MCRIKKECRTTSLMVKTVLHTAMLEKCWTIKHKNVENVQNIQRVCITTVLKAKTVLQTARPIYIYIFRFTGEQLLSFYWSIVVSSKSRLIKYIHEKRMNCKLVIKNLKVKGTKSLKTGAHNEAKRIFLPKELLKGKLWLLVRL